MQSDFDLNWLDFGFRFYDPVIARFPTVDPIIESFPHLTPYNYASNDPIGNIDLWGLQGVRFEMAFADPGLNAVNATKEERRQYQKDMGAGFAGGVAAVGSLFAPGPEDVILGGWLLRAVGLGKKAAKAGDAMGDVVDEGGHVFRGDSRAPEEIFENGFKSKGKNKDLKDHAENNPDDSNFISTTKDPNVAREDFSNAGDHVFTIKKPGNGVDVNKKLGNKSPFPSEKEIAVPNSIPPSQIKGARKVGVDGKFKGPFIKNPKSN